MVGGKSFQKPGWQKQETRLVKNRVSVSPRNPVGKKPGFSIASPRNPVGKKPGFIIIAWDRIFLTDAILLVLCYN